MSPRATPEELSTAKTAEPTIEILKQIRDEVAATCTALGARIDATNARIDVTNTRLDAMERSTTESEVRVATELIAVAQAVGSVRDLLRERLDERERIDDHERRIVALEKKSA